MKKELDNLCEIIFTDHKLGCLKSQIGWIDNLQLETYSTNINDFVLFKERYNPPILKTDIKEIIIHRDNRQTQLNEEDSIISKHTKTQSTGKIS